MKDKETIDMSRAPCRQNLRNSCASVWYDTASIYDTVSPVFFQFLQDFVALGASSKTFVYDFDDPRSNFFLGQAIH
jgi:hypothetical protein